jgi:dienelactone hydrolase
MTVAGAPDASSPVLTVEPPSALLDEPVAIRLTGLVPGEGVALMATMTDHVDRRWQSAATFTADDAGVVDVPTQAPIVSSYDGAEPMGLFWSMTLETPGGVPVPLLTTEPLVVVLTAVVAEQVVAEARLERRLLAPGVTDETVHDDGLVGRFFRPAGTGPFPAVLTLGGSGGGLGGAWQQAALLATRGYAALALAYFNYEHLPPYLHAIPLEYFATALHWLQRRPEVRADRLAVRGYSRGGELALLLGATFPALTAVVGYVPSGVVHGSIGVVGEPSWTFQGEPVPYLFPPDAAARHEQVTAQEPVALTPWYLGNLEHREAVAQAAIPVERINGPVLLLSGEDDQMWPSPVLAGIAAERLAQHGHPYPVRHCRYAGAGHAIILPNLTMPTGGQHPVRGVRVTFGGTAAANARAATEAWGETLQCLDNWRRS